MVGENTSRFLPPAALQPDPHRLCRAAVEERDIVGGPCVLGVVGENEDRPVPGAAVRASIIEDVPAVASTQHGASGLDVLLDKAGAYRESRHPVHRMARPRYEPVQRYREVPEHLARGGLPFRVSHGRGDRSAGARPRLCGGHDQILSAVRSFCLY